MFVDKSPYGWGGWRVPMPRSSADIYADRRVKKGGHHGSERRRGLYFKPLPVIVIEFLGRDLPVSKVLCAGTFGLALTVFLVLTGWFIPQMTKEETPREVEILARLLEEPPPKVLEPTAPPLVPPAVAEKTVSEPPPAKTAPKPKAMIPPPVQRELPEVRPLEVKIAAPKPVQPELDIKPPTMERNLAPDRNTSSALPKFTRRSGETEAVPPIRRPLVVNAPPENSRYKLPETRSGSLPASQVFSPRAAGTTVDLPTAPGLKTAGVRPRSRGDAAVPVSGRAFSPPGGVKQVALKPAGSVGDARRTLTEDRNSFGPLTAGKKTAVGSGPEKTVDIPAATDIGPGAIAFSSRESKTGTGMPAENVRYITGREAGDLDPDLFVSLNQLGACVDQSREDRLRTKLATRLERNGQCRTGDMIFFFKYPETGWTMQVDIYNPVKFPDKCAALSAAIECIHHSK